MFNLIVSMMSIALAGMTALVAISYGGVIFSEKGGQGGARAQAVTLLNNAQQVSGAQRAYAIRHSGLRASDYEALVASDYLVAVPELPVGAVIDGWSMSPDGTTSRIPLSIDRDGQTGSPADRICELLADFGGAVHIEAADSLPEGSDLDGAGVWFGCVTNPGAATVEAAAQVWFVHRN